MVWLRGKAAVLAAFGALSLTAAPGFGQEEPTTPPPRPDAGTVTPVVPDGGPTPPVLSLPPGNAPGMGLGGRDCESERAPGVGV